MEEGTLSAHRLMAKSVSIGWYGNEMLIGRKSDWPFFRTEYPRNPAHSNPGRGTHGAAKQTVASGAS
jgi:hypothetical protein